MPETLPLLPTSTAGSYAMPSWLWSAAAEIQAGGYGPRDVEETLNDAVDIALLDQERAGIDIVTDGEMRRLDFVVGFYDRLRGIRPMDPERRKGHEGHDMRPKWEIVDRLEAPAGLGIAEEYRYLASRTGRPKKSTCPGPFTLSGRLLPGSVYRDRLEVAWRLAEIVNAELKRTVEAGATFLQLDEPSAAVYPDRLQEYVNLLNATVAGVRAKIAVHVCFGNWRCKPVGKRTYRPLFPRIFEARVDQWVLEFANREMSEIGLWSEFPSDKELGCGVVDVKSYYIETEEDVAERIRLALRHVHPEKLTLLPDCGLSQTARWAAFRKLQALAAGARRVRQELLG